MSLPLRLAPLVALVAALATGTCVYPTEHDADVHVSVTPLPILIRGNDALATARAWQVLGTGDSAEITNISFVWSSGNASVATVDPSGHIVGIKSGTTTIRAAAANFDKRSQPGDITLRVAERLEIDSIRPKTVHFGDTVTLFGVDWYRLQQAGTRDLTIIITAPAVKGTFAGFVSDQFGGANAWTIGPGSHNCRGKKFSPDEAAGDSTIVALAGVPAPGLDAIAIFTQHGRYSLLVADKYLTSDSLDARIEAVARQDDA